MRVETPTEEVFPSPVGVGTLRTWDPGIGLPVEPDPYVVFGYTPVVGFGLGVLGQVQDVGDPESLE